MKYFNNLYIRYHNCLKEFNTHTYLNIHFFYQFSRLDIYDYGLMKLTFYQIGSIYAYTYRQKLLTP